MTFVVDANVLSEATKPSPEMRVVAHGLTVATRNVRELKKAGVKVVDPFA